MQKEPIQFSTILGALPGPGELPAPGPLTGDCLVPAPLTRYEDVREVTAEEYYEGDKLAVDTFNTKYAFAREDGTRETPAECFRRQAAYQARHMFPDDERRRAYWEALWFHGMWNRFIVAGGRIQAGAGHPSRKVSQVNCTTKRIESDSLEAIMDDAYRIGRYQSYGQGIGTDITALRPAGSKVGNSAGTTSGAVNWMKMADTMTGCISQHGRRGALLIAIAVSHPESLDQFVKVKSDLNAINNANISVKFDDVFMRAVETGGEYQHYWDDEHGVRKYFQKVNAREKFREFCEHARKYAEPGALYWDTTMREGNSNYLGNPRWEIVCVNACSEQGLESDGTCVLAHAVLSTLPWRLGWAAVVAELKARAWVLAHFLDGVVTSELADRRYPLDAQRESLVSLRRIGVGFTDFAGLMTFLKVPYDSEEATAKAEELTKALAYGSYRASVWLGHDRAPYLAASPSVVNSGYMQRAIEGGLLTADEASRMRNVCTTTIAPVGTGSIVTQTFGSGIEPSFGGTYYRRSRASGEYMWYFVVSPFLKKHWETLTGVAWPYTALEEADPARWDEIRAYVEGLVPADICPSAESIDPIQKVRMMGRVQKWIDSAISVTFNTRNATVDDYEAIYLEAWRHGLKGVSVYDVNPENREPILQYERPTTWNFAPEKMAGAAAPAASTAESRVAERFRRPASLPAQVYLVRSKREKYYITAAHADGDPSVLQELFISCRNAPRDLPFVEDALRAAQALASRHGIGDAALRNQERKNEQQGEGPAQLLGRVLSVALRHGASSSEAWTAIATACPGAPAGSLVYHLLKVLGRHAELSAPSGQGDCPTCGAGLVHDSGCTKCLDCGYSRC